METYLKTPYDVRVGDIVCESDGFMWTVIDREYRNGRYNFVLSPRFQSITARESCMLKVKKSSFVRVAR